MIRDKIITLGYGSGGLLSKRLIEELFVKELGNSILNELKDSAILNLSHNRLAFTTDSYTVDPIFFNGGDIGKLAVCGTVNDLAVVGATPLYLSLSLIIEEGLKFETLRKIIRSIKNTAMESGVKIVTGDTKVVNKGKADRIFINTAGVGSIKKNVKLSVSKISNGDSVIINGPLGQHSISIIQARNEFNFHADIKTDCAPLNELISSIMKVSNNVKFMRDITRGGLATVLNEIITKRFGVIIEEEKIPITKPVNVICNILGFDPLYLANEGRVVVFVDPGDAKKVLSVMKKHRYGKRSRIIGRVVTNKDYRGRIFLKTGIGGLRIVDMMTADQLPRIC